MKDGAKRFVSAGIMYTTALNNYNKCQKWQNTKILYEELGGSHRYRSPKTQLWRCEKPRGCHTNAHDTCAGTFADGSPAGNSRTP